MCEGHISLQTCFQGGLVCDCEPDAASNQTDLPANNFKIFLQFALKDSCSFEVCSSYMG